MTELEILRLPAIDSLKQLLNISTPNSGHPNLSFQSFGLHVDDLEAQHAILNEHDEVQFNTGIEFPSVVYRGQVQEFDTCMPGLGRLNNIEDKLVSICRNIAFEDAIRVHPYVSYCAQQEFNGHSIHVDYQGLAQHYGFHTNMIDVTSNFDVASFFASCEWSAKKGCYIPVASGAKPGVIYSVIPALFVPGSTQTAKFNFVGWQPLPRPAQQRAGAFILPHGKCFTNLPSVQRMYFRHDETAAEKLLQAFDGGKALFPHDEAAALSYLAKDLVLVTRGQLERAWKMLENWEGRYFSKKRRSNVFKASDLKIVKKPPLNWACYNLPAQHDKLHTKLNSELNNVRLRLTYRPPI